MYDSMGIWVDSNCMESLPDKLTDVKRQVDSNGVCDTAGKLGNMRVSVNDRGCSISGSLCKFHHGDNMQRLTRQETKKAIEHLSDCLGLDLNQGRVYRLEVGENFVMKEPVSVYCSLCGDASRYSRSVMKMGRGEGLYYTNSLRSLYLYDKIGELKKKRVPIPELFNSRNVLRYEIRYTTRLPKQFSTTVLRCSDLYREDFYSKIVERWKGEYFSIQKQKQQRFDMKKIKDARTLKSQLALIGLDALGGEEVALEMLKNSRQSGELGKMQFHRLKAMVKELASDERLTVENDAILELDSKVRLAARYAR